MNKELKKALAEALHSRYHDQMDEAEHVQFHALLEYFLTTVPGFPDLWERVFHETL